MGITFKETKIGRIPEEWELHQAKRVAFVNMGQSPSSSDCNDEGIGVPFLQGNADFGDKYPKISSWTTNPTKIAKPNDILMSVRAPVGDINLADTECCIGRGLCAITPRSGTDLLFLYYVLKGSMPRLLRFQQGSTFLAINKQNIDSHLVPLPPLPEQHKIAEILSTVDETIEKTDTIIQETQQLKKGLMQKLFTEGIGHTRFKETKIGRIPEEWECRSIGEFVTEFRGGASLTPSDFISRGKKVLPKVGVVPGGVLRIPDDKQQYCSEEYAEANHKSVVDSKFIIVVLRDLVPSGPSIGLMVRITDGDEYVLAQGVYGLRIDGKRLDEIFLVQLSNSSWYRKYMRRILVGSTQVHIRNSEFRNVLIPYPGIEEQERISQILVELDTQIEHNIAYRTNLEQLKKGLMQVLLTGKVRVQTNE